jgi:hypothetical protein
VLIGHSAGTACVIHQYVSRSLSPWEPFQSSIITWQCCPQWSRRCATYFPIVNGWCREPSGRAPSTTVVVFVLDRSGVVSTGGNPIHHLPMALMYYCLKISIAMYESSIAPALYATYERSIGTATKVVFQRARLGHALGMPWARLGQALGKPWANDNTTDGII